ncbi:unnamed protein product [Arabidopsis halleri]
MAAGKFLLHYAVIDFHNTDAAWRKYDSVTARELFQQFGCSESLYRNILRPLLQVSLFAPPEQCSAAATLALFYYLILSYQKDFDMVWSRGTVREMIFNPWTDSLKERGCRFLRDKLVADFILSDDESGYVTQVVCGRDKYEADAVILAGRISTLQETIKKRSNVFKVLPSSAIICLLC